MNIKNYTSSVAASKSQIKIEQLLIEIGAMGISKEYKDKKISAISFSIIVDGTKLFYELPVDVEEVYNVLIKKTYKRPTQIQSDNVLAQSERTTWKLLSEWVEIQCSMILMRQGKPEQMFFQYMLNADGNTLYEVARENNFKALNP